MRALCSRLRGQRLDQRRRSRSPERDILPAPGMAACRIVLAGIPLGLIIAFGISRFPDRRSIAGGVSIATQV